MNNFEMAIGLIMQAMRNGELLHDVSYYFDIAEQIEKEAIKRHYIELKVCDKCKSEIKSVDLGGQFRVQCDCKKGSGETRQEAFDNWLEK